MQNNAFCQDKNSSHMPHLSFLSYRFLRIAPLCYSKTSTRFQRVSMKTGRNFIRYSSFQYFQITPFTIRYRIVALGESSSSANTRHSKTDFNASSRCLTFLVMNIAVLECSAPMYDIPIMPKFFSLQFSLGSPPFREPLRGSLRYINCSNPLVDGIVCTQRLFKISQTCSAITLYEYFPT